MHIPGLHRPGVGFYYQVTELQLSVSVHFTLLELKTLCVYSHIRKRIYESSSLQMAAPLTLTKLY